jgi:hypothetical protein
MSNIPAILTESIGPQATIPLLLTFGFFSAGAPPPPAASEYLMFARHHKRR